MHLSGLEVQNGQILHKLNYPKHKKRNLEVCGANCHMCRVLVDAYHYQNANKNDLTQWFQKKKSIYSMKILKWTKITYDTRNTIN